MGLALVFINLLVYIICSETHTLQRARRKRQCISYPCAPDQTSVPPCPSECCASEAMIPCNSGPPPAPTSQCPCGKLMLILRQLEVGLSHQWHDLNMSVLSTKGRKNVKSVWVSARNLHLTNKECKHRQRLLFKLGLVIVKSLEVEINH